MASCIVLTDFFTSHKGEASPLPLRGGTPLFKWGVPKKEGKEERVMNENRLPAIKVAQYALEQAMRHSTAIRAKLVRFASPALTRDCVEAGLTTDLADLCGGLLASVIDDLIAVGKLPRTDFGRTKRKERILAACQEPASSALKIAIAASPINGRAAIAHWDMLCGNKYEKHEIGKLAWLLGVDTDAARRYSRRIDQRS
jgi:hypothetical protein